MLLGPLERTAAKNILRAASSEVFRSVYFLGPFARRVNFSAQQNRVLNLIWALQASGRIQKGDKIGVVGAGLAGVTACAALDDLGYEAFLFERGESPLNRQISARHRFIHPSINRWPEAPLAWTTRLPYFDWVGEICTTLLDDLREEWDGRAALRAYNFAPDTVVTGFSEPPNSGDVAVETDGPCRFSAARFKAVVVTSGFADESVPAGSDLKTYWDPDSIEQRIARNEVKHVIISGCGDGGLIDALRLAHEKFRDGRLTVDVVEALDRSRWPWREKIAAAEREVAETETSLRDAIERGSETLQKTYMEAARYLPKDIEAVLAGSLRKKKPRLVGLYSMETWPFTPMAAPIHKLLIAHAIENVVVKHTPSKVVHYDKDRLVFVPLRHDPKDSSKHEHAEGPVIIRHGARPNFAAFFKPDQKSACEDLIQRQKLLADDLDSQIWASAKPPLKLWPPQAGFAEELRARRKQGDKLIRRTVGASCIFTPDEFEGFILEHGSEAGVVAKVNSLPDNLFGFPLKRYLVGTRAPAEGRPLGMEKQFIRGEAPWQLYPGYEVYSALDGRLGAFVRDEFGKVFALTVGHVVAFGAQQLKEVFDGEGRVVGYADREDTFSDRQRDGITLIHLDPERPFASRYGRFAAISEVVDPIDAFGQEVMLVNRRGSVNHGIVSATRCPVSYFTVGYEGPIELVVEEAIRVRSRNGLLPFAEPGDSGAPVVDSSGKLVGLVLSEDRSFTYVAPVKEFLAQRGLTLVSFGRASACAPPNLRDDPFQFARDAWRMAEMNRSSLLGRPLSLGDMPEDSDDGQ